MSAPTVFLSAASIDLEEWRNILHRVLSDGGVHVLTQGNSFGMAPRDVRDLLIRRIDESDFVFRLAGTGYGSHATDPFPDAPAFECSWTQFEYYYAHRKRMPVFAAVLHPDLSKAGFVEEGGDAERARKTELQRQHRLRVESGEFDATPLAASGIGRTSNSSVKDIPDLIRAVAGVLRETMRGLSAAAPGLAAVLDQRLRLHTLPPLPPGFVGRETDLEKLRAFDPAAGALLTGLRGMGGIGKTALALVLAHEWAARFPDAQLFLDARGTQADPPSAGDLLAQIIQTFHPTARLPDDEAALRAIYHDLLREKKVLLLLDNARDAAQAAPLIPPAGCALIVTSRQSFMLGKTAPHNVGRLPDTDAVELLREFYAGLGEADAAEIVRLCAGLPLALRLAGAHLALDATERDGPPDVAGYLRALGGGRLRNFDADAAGAGEKSVTETLRLSEERLPPAERAAWRKLGVFTASFEAGAAAALAGADGEMLARLVHRSLLEREGADRCKLHDLAADYARAQLGGEELIALHLEHARYFQKVGAEADDIYLKGDAVGGLALFDRERAQIEAAFGWLEKVVQSFSSRDSATPEASRASDAVRAEAQDYVPAATVLLALVTAVAYTSDLRFHPRQRIAWLETQRDAARLTGNRQAEGTALGNLGLAHAALGDARQAIEFYEQVLVIMREVGDRRGEGTALGNLGLARADLGDARQAIEFYEQQLAITREIGDRRGEANALFNSALRLETLGQQAEARARAEQAAEIYAAIESPHAEKARWLADRLRG